MRRRFMRILLLLLFLAGNLSAQEAPPIYNVGLLIVATGKYIRYVQPLIDSAEKYFCKNHRVTYFVFTDGEPPKADNIIKLEHKKLGWPYDTMMRLAVYDSYHEILETM